MKKIMSILLVLCLALVPCIVFANDESNISSAEITVKTIEVAGKTIEGVRTAYAENGCELAEVRKVAEALGYTVEWYYNKNIELEKVYLKNIYGCFELIFTVGSDECTYTPFDVYEYMIDPRLPEYKIDGLIDSSVEKIDGTIYAPLVILEGILQNYNQLELNELDLLGEYDLLDGGLKIKMPKTTGYEGSRRMRGSIMSSYVGSREETTLRFSHGSGEVIAVTARNMFSLSVGDMKKDAENLGGAVADGAEEYTQNDLTLLELETGANDSNMKVVKECLVMEKDGKLNLVYISMNEKARENEILVNELPDKIMATLRGGEVMPKEYGLELNLPEGYEAIRRYGVDFSTLSIVKYTKTDENYVYLGIYTGYYPSADPEYLEKKSVSTRNGRFLDGFIKWYIMEDGSMEALFDRGGLIYHFYSSSLTYDESKEFIDIISNIKVNE